MRFKEFLLEQNVRPHNSKENTKLVKKIQNTDKKNNRVDKKASH